MVILCRHLYKIHFKLIKTQAKIWNSRPLNNGKFKERCILKAVFLTEKAKDNIEMRTSYDRLCTDIANGLYLLLYIF